MARYIEPTAEQQQGWRDWVNERPPVVRAIAERFDPWSLYRLKSTKQRVTLASISETGTVSVNVTGEFNLLMYERQVFGIDPEDLEPCELPAANEAVGTMLSPDQVEDNIDVMRVIVRPDLWELDATGKAVRKDRPR